MENMEWGLAEIPWEYAWDLAAKTPLARPLARRLLGQPFQPPEFHPLSSLLFLFRCLPGKIVAHRHA